MIARGQIGALLNVIAPTLRVKLALGLFEHPFVDETAGAKAFFQPASLELAQTAAERSLVLLKNARAANGKPILPLGQDIQNLALIGPLADESSDPQGAGAATTPREVLSFPKALAQRVGQDHLFVFKGTGITAGTDEEIATAVAGARKADVVILTLGEDPDMSGEAASRAHLGLPGRQSELLEAIVNTGKPVVLILFSGRPLTLPWAFEHAPAVIAAWFPGTQTGSALARALFGEVNPSGKLVVSWPRSVGQEPLYYNALSTGRPPGNADLSHPPETADDRYLSRYIDEQNTPQFPFGYGGSYTTFAYGTVKISNRRLSAKALNHSLGETANPAVTVEADVSNTGLHAGEEVVQLYVRLQGTSVAQPVRALKGFQRVALGPAETKTVRFDLKPEVFSIWNDRNEFAAEPANVSLWVSPDSAHGSEARMEIVP
jgi:beta-glucosidase